MTRPRSPKRQRRRAPATPPVPVHDLDGMLRRLHLPTVRRLYADLATRAEADGMSYHTYLETLIAEEIAHFAETRLPFTKRRCGPAAGMCGLLGLPLCVNECLFRLCSTLPG